LEGAIEVVEELDWDAALSAARLFFAERGKAPAYPTDLADYLRTSVSQAMELCDALEKEGSIATTPEHATSDA
jgi:hypothetical protein